ncbi:hypothetical protein ISU10_04200 [Nocardioides agariphilus]|uniref:Uncharacterized protein n=1 Tax=Nocardioides agariphilus TaxID=433664 RepID=A0A930YHG1_9ACTN|nr:hypothetical protein [Nocardioides agariphilus]MBF4766963.1 hypothetical protein [Nocardioides agariphilus]
MHRSPTLVARLTGPGLLLAAALMRWADGRHGDLGDQPWTALAHLAFGGALLAFVAVAAGVRRVAAHRRIVTVAVVGAALGVLGVALGTPGGFAVFVLGVVGTLAALAAARQVSWLEPALALAGFAAVAGDLDLLALGAALLAGAFAQAPAPARPKPQPV